MKRLVVLLFCLQFCLGHPISADEPEPARQVVDDGKYYVISPSEDHVMLDALSLRKDTLSFYVGFKSGCHLEQFTEQLLGHFMLDGSNEVFLTYIFSSNKIRVKTKTLEAYQTLEEFGDKNIGGPASVAFKVTFDWHKNRLKIGETDLSLSMLNKNFGDLRRNIINLLLWKTFGVCETVYFLPKEETENVPPMLDGRSSLHEHQRRGLSTEKPATGSENETVFSAIIVFTQNAASSIPAAPKSLAAFFQAYCWSIFAVICSFIFGLAMGSMCGSGANRQNNSI